VTTTDTLQHKALLKTSYPSSTTVWTAIGQVGPTALSSGRTMTVTAFALCSP
jgi:hypothetical protein